MHYRYRRQNRSHRAPLDQLSALRELAGKTSSYTRRYGALRHYRRCPHHPWSCGPAAALIRSRFPSQTMTYCCACSETF